MPINAPVQGSRRWRHVQAVLLRYGFDIVIEKNEIKEARRWLREELRMPLAEMDGRSVPELARLVL